VADRAVAWPFLLAASRTSAYRLVVAPDFMATSRASLAALRAAPDHLTGTVSTVAVRDVDGPDGPFRVVYRVAGDRMRDFGLGGDEPVTDRSGRRIDVFEGLVCHPDPDRETWPAIGWSDLERAHDLVREDYRRFWSADGRVRATRSASFPVTGRGGPIRPAVLPPQPGEQDQEAPVITRSWPTAAAPATVSARASLSGGLAPSAGGQAPSPCGQPPAPGGVRGDQPDEPPPVEPPLGKRAPDGRMPGGHRDPAPQRKPQRRTRGLAIGVAALVVAAAAGGYAWSRSATAPVLRPTDLHVAASQPTSITLDWTRPATGPTPDRYLIAVNAGLAGQREIQVAGTATSYGLTGLMPATSYQVRLTAIRGGVSSPESAPLVARTTTPPPWQGLLTGRWLVRYAHSPTTRAWWDVTAGCDSGACQQLTLSGTVGGGAWAIPFSVPLTLSGASYRGSGRALGQVCVGDANRPIRARDTLTFTIDATQAGLSDGRWTVTGWQGSVEVDIPTVPYKDKSGRRKSCAGGVLQFFVAS
jgi:Fibronectin type III domain